MKVTVRIPTTQYGYIEAEQEYESVEEALQDYDRLVAVYTGGDGLSQKEWVQERNSYINEGKIDVEQFERMDKRQTDIINEIKLARRSNK